MRSNRGLPIALRIWALSPGVLAVLMFIVTPNYVRPMRESLVGWLLLSFLATTICVAYGLVEVAAWLFRRGRVGLGVLVLVIYSISWLAAVSIILLGPAAVILMKPRS